MASIGYLNKLTTGAYEGKLRNCSRDWLQAV